MVCLGNICRSPMAEAVFADLASKRSALAGRIKVDSAGTAGYHGGDDPDERTVEVSIDERGRLGYMWMRMDAHLNIAPCRYRLAAKSVAISSDWSIFQAMIT